MPHQRLNIDLDELASVMEMHFHELKHFLDTETGAIHSVDDEYWDDSEIDSDDSGEDDAATDELPPWQREARALAAQIRDDDQRFVPIPEIESHDAYRVMEDFIEHVTDVRLRERLADAIAGKGAFRRFKDTLLSYPRAREDWFRFDAAVKQQWAAEWLASIGIESTWKPPAATKD